MSDLLDIPEIDTGEFADLQGELLRADFNAFATAALAPLGQAPARHHRLMNAAIQRLLDGKSLRTMLLLPPGSAKSTYSSILLPPFALAQPDVQNIITASASADLAEAFLAKALRVANDMQEVLGYGFTKSTINTWRTNTGKELRAFGAGAGTAGRRADCLVGSTKIITRGGPVAISDLAARAPGDEVLSYDETTGSVEFRKVQAALSREVGSVVRVTTTHGRVVEATGNHRFLTSAGWVSAEVLAPGDVLLRLVREDGNSNGRRGKEKIAAGADTLFLQPELQHSPSQQGTRRFGSSMSVVQGSAGNPKDCRQLNTDMLSCLQNRDTQGQGPKDSNSSRESLRSMPSCLPACNRQLQESVLLAGVSRSCQANGNERGEKPRISTRHPGEGTRPKLHMEADTAEHHYAGLGGVRCVPLSGAPGGSPHQPDTERPQRGKFSDALQNLPHAPACDGEGYVESDTVALVERLCRRDVVYDIQVEGTNCFFANEILVHNCVIIDDPFGSWADAARQGKRDEIYDWYTGDIIGRLKPGGRILLVNTHWHEDDLSGRLMERMREGGEYWDIVSMQAIYDGTEEDPLGRSIGEALWPEWEGVEALTAKRLSIGETKWAALFQQNPTPSGGLLFKVDCIAAVPHLPPGPRRSVRKWDFAATEEKVGQAPDWTVGVKLTRVGEAHWCVEDVRRERLSPAGVKKLVLETAQIDGHGVSIGLSQDPGSAGKFVIADMTAMLAGHHVVGERETGSKADRALPVASQVEAGNVSMLRAPWNEGFKVELSRFPNGKHDDQVDALAGAFKMLHNPARGTEGRRINWGSR